MDTIVKQLSSTDLAALSTAVQAKAGMAQKVVERLKTLTAADVTSWATEQWQRVPVDNLKSMSQSVLQKVPMTEVGKWTEVLFAVLFYDFL